MYGWYFLWRHLVVPKPSASDALERLLTKSRGPALETWETNRLFSPNGFDAYFLFKILLVCFAGLVFLHSIAFFSGAATSNGSKARRARANISTRTCLTEGDEAYEGTH